MPRFVEITQYMRPSGRPIMQHLEVDTETAKNCYKITGAGFRFECEVLSGGIISLTITDDDADHATELVDNVPGNVGRAFMAMTQRFAKGLK